MTTLVTLGRLFEMVQVIWSKIIALSTDSYPSSLSAALLGVEDAPQDSKNIRDYCETLLMNLRGKRHAINACVREEFLQDDNNKFQATVDGLTTTQLKQLHLIDVQFESVPSIDYDTSKIKTAISQALKEAVSEMNSGLYSPELVKFDRHVQGIARSKNQSIHYWNNMDRQLKTNMIAQIIIEDTQLPSVDLLSDLHACAEDDTSFHEAVIKFVDDHMRESKRSAKREPTISGGARSYRGGRGGRAGKSRN